MVIKKRIGVEKKRIAEHKLRLKKSLIKKKQTIKGKKIKLKLLKYEIIVEYPDGNDKKIGEKSSLSEAKKFAIKEDKLFSKKMELWEDKGCKGSINKYYKGKLTEGCGVLIKNPDGKKIMLIGRTWENYGD